MLYRGIEGKSEICDEVEENGTTEKRQRMRSDSSEDLDKGCYKWLLNVRHKNVPVNGIMVQVKALYFRKELGLSYTFQASDGWI